jgi:hypothetical protein
MGALAALLIKYFPTILTLVEKGGEVLRNYYAQQKAEGLAKLEQSRNDRDRALVRAARERMLLTTCPTCPLRLAGRDGSSGLTPTIFPSLGSGS